MHGLNSFPVATDWKLAGGRKAAKESYLCGSPWLNSWIPGNGLWKSTQSVLSLLHLPRMLRLPHRSLRHRIYSMIFPSARLLWSWVWSLSACLDTESAEFCVLSLSGTPRPSTGVICLPSRLSRDFIGRKSKTRNPLGISGMHSQACRYTRSFLHTSSRGWTLFLFRYVIFQWCFDATRWNGLLRGNLIE